jgi:hypothetical protein
MENWKDVPCYEGYYQVSDQGRVRNSKGRVMSPNRLLHGYLTVHLYKGGKHTRKVHCVHRLVLRAFTGVVGHEANHLNNDRADNRLQNIEWCTRAQNVAHMVAQNRQARNVKAVKGIAVGSGIEVVFESQIAAEEALTGKRTGAISRCVREPRRVAYGYRWAAA